MWAIIKLRIGKHDKAFFSEGSMELLENIEKYKSIKKATESMGMSYTKALKIIRTIEREVEFPIVISEKGGNTHGMTKLTDKGKMVLTSFQEMNAELSAFAEKLLAEKFKF